MIGLSRRSLLLSLVAASVAAAQSNAVTQQDAWDPQRILKTETFVRPPANVERIIMAPRTDITFTAPSPDRKWFLKTAGADRGDVVAYGKPHIYLAGVVIDTLANRARSLTTSTRRELVLVDPRTNATRTIETPKGAAISAQSWSPAGTHVGYIANFDNASHVFVADVVTGKSTQLTKTPLLGTLVTSFEWTGDGKAVVVVQVPDARGAKPMHGNNGIEDGPQVRLTDSRIVPQVIHFSLLEDPHDKAMLRYYTTGQLAIIDIRTKAIRTIGRPSMIRSVEASPDGKYFRVTQMTEPFSYLVPASAFGSVEELWDASGKVLATLTKTPLREGERQNTTDVAPRGGGRGGDAAGSDTAMRNIQWNPIGPGVVYLQSVFSEPAQSPSSLGVNSARGTGRGAAVGPRQPSSVRFMSWMPPFGPGDAKLVYEGSGRLTGVAYGVDGKTMFVADSGTVIAIRDGKRFSLGRGVTLPATGGGFGFGGGGGGRGGAASADTAVAGGALALRPNAHGIPSVIVSTDNKSVFVSGTRQPGANWQAQGPRPWVDRLDIETAQRTRVFDNPDAGAYDEFVTALDDDYSHYIYTHESPTVITDAYIRDAKANTSRKITNNRDVAPEVTGAIHERMVVTRPRDGLKFFVDVTLPKTWTPGTKLPGIIWFYPREYTTQEQYDQSKYSVNVNQFPDVPSLRPASSVKLWVAQGYALIEPDIPVFGDAGRMNDNYTRDVKENLDAVLDAVVEAGYVDRNRMGIGGHSYGAFSTVNAMTLVPYFKAGIAGDGMYNRSLTPFGFQSESRNFFQAQDTYLDMSPFYRADKLSGALLMYHNGEDQNVGTALISSTRMFHALQGLGKTAALYVYPYEDHSVATYASDLDQWARWFAWFDVYVKGAKAVVP
jgi:dipeptidyl aminopeptidase/acylaminoacyl peptidase